MQPWNLWILLENISNRFHLTLELYVNRRDILNIRRKYLHCVINIS